MNIPGAYSLIVEQQHLSLLPQRAIFWHEEKTLMVADVHLGKAQTFQRAGIAIPADSFGHDLERLSELLKITQADRLLVLGDFVHHRSGLTGAVMRDIRIWCGRLMSELIVVLGNHDKPNRTLLADLPLTLCEPFWQCGPFLFAHDDDQDISASFKFIGHLHPVVNLPQLRVPAFAFYPNYCILPAFSYFTGGAPVRRDQAKIYLPLEEAGKVIALPALIDG